MKSKLKVLATMLLLGSIVACNNGGSTNSESTNDSSMNSDIVSVESSASESSSNETSSNLTSSTNDSSSSVDQNISESSSDDKSNYETVNYELNISDLESGVKDTDTIVNRFTIPAGTTIRDRTKSFGSITYTKSVKLGDSSSSIIVNSPGEGKLKFHIQNGSSGATTQNVTISGPKGDNTLEFEGTNASSPVVELECDVTEGIYTIKRVSGTIDIYYLHLSCSVEKADETGFEIVSKGKTDYIEGEEFDCSSLLLNKVFGNGRTDSLDINSIDVTIDSSSFDKTKPGNYEIKVKYKNYESINYTVTVHEINSLSLSFDSIEKVSNNSAGNGVYYNHSTREVYRLGEEFDKKGLTVKANSTNKSFFITDNVTITGFDSTVAGEKTITVSFTTNNKTLTKEFYVYVVDTAPSKNLETDTYQVKVDQNYTGPIGAISNGYNCFTTVQQAIDYLNNSSEISSSDKKLMYIANGTYNEKLEIEIPFLTIEGESAENTIIEWDSIYGVEDGSGFVHVTDSTSTVAVREQAYRCTINNITISNYYNSQERLNERNRDIERALALLVQSDQFIMKNSRLLGIQDTLELFTGRQYFENTYISGYTDFIFGTNNTTYFTNCEIHTINTNKNSSGTAGYITAFKGCNKGESDSVLYGAIFDGCNFTADDEIETGKTAIGRTWGAYAAVAVINSNLEKHISKDGYTSSSNKNTRYIAMNGKPTDATVKFVEYNNTGDGAIAEAVDGCRILTDDEASNYNNFEVIFAATNGNVKYSDSWDPTSLEVVVDDSIYYHFDGKSTPTGTSYLFSDKYEGNTGTFEGLTIDATNGKVAARGTDTQINSGSKIIFNVKAGTIVTINTYPSYHSYTLNGVEADSDSFSQYYAEDTEVTLEATSQIYLYSIVINPNEAAPL